MYNSPYLSVGKEGVLGIARFRRLNIGVLDDLKLPAPPDVAYPGDTSVDVVLTETEDVKDRTSYYDDFGVIRDVMQNHMTQVMYVVLVILVLCTLILYLVFIVHRHLSIPL